MPSRSGRDLLPWISLFIIWTVWSSTYLGMSAAVETMPPFLMSGIRFLLAGVILLILALPARRKGSLQVTGAELRSSALIGVLMLLGGPGLVGLAQTELDSSLAALIVATTPIVMTFMTLPQTRRRPDAGTMVALVMGVVGIGVMVGSPGSAVPVIPSLLVFISVFFWSGGTILARFLPLPKHPFVGLGIQMLFGGMALLAVAGLRGEFGELTIDAISMRSWLGFGWLVLAGSLIGYTAFMHANATLPIEIVATYAYVNPVLAVILGATLDDDAIGPNVLIGGGIIVLAVVFIVSGRIVRRGRPAPGDEHLADRAPVPPEPLPEAHSDEPAPIIRPGYATEP